MSHLLLHIRFRREVIGCVRRARDEIARYALAGDEPPEEFLEEIVGTLALESFRAEDLGGGQA